MTASIWQRRRQLESARRNAVRIAMADYDKDYYAKLNELREECGSNEGHTMQFTHVGPLGNPWFACSKCGKTEVKELA
jgi:hypothetical protein